MTFSFLFIGRIERRTVSYTDAVFWFVMFGLPLLIVAAALALAGAKGKEQ